MSEPRRITAWVCDECDYWRKDRSSAKEVVVHQTTNPTDLSGPLVKHPLRKAVFVEVQA